MESSRSPSFLSSSRDPNPPERSAYRDVDNSTSAWSPLSASSQRQLSFNSVSSFPASKSFSPNQIALEDHTHGHFDESGGLWAKSVTIDNYTIVGDSALGGSYIVWNCTVETLDGGPLKIRKRYSEFDTLRQNLIRTFPHSSNALPQLPRKSVVSRFRSRFLEKRRDGLTYFLSCVLLNPEFASSPVLIDFLFS